MTFTELKKTLEPLKEGSSYRNIYKLLYYICLFKYSNRELLQKSFTSAFKIATKEKIKFLNNLGYFDLLEDVIIPNKTTFEILQILDKKDLDLDYSPSKLLPALPSGMGNINELNNTEVFIQAVNLPDFYSLLFPNFGYIIPDALLVRKNGDKYKLEFLEIEASKENWSSYLENKHQNYLQLATNKDVYDYWLDCCDIFKWSIPDINNFKFSVVIIGKIKRDWEDCFIFRETLNGS